MIENLIQIIDELNADININSKLSKITIGKPENTDNLYAFFSIITWSDKNGIETRSRVQLFVVNSDYLTLNEVITLIRNKILKTNKLWTFEYFRVNATLPIDGVNSLRQKTLTCDFIFNYTLKDY